VLVLTRRLNEKVVLPGLGVIIEVVAVKGNVVRLGIQAPADVIIMREELIGASAAPVPSTPAASR
jgi:carbon storage regulator CsrA